MQIKSTIIIVLLIIITLLTSCKTTQNQLPQRTYNFKILTQNSKVQFLFKNETNYTALKSITLPNWEGCEGKFKRGAFSNCTAQKLEYYINEHFTIPQIALDSAIEGKIGYQFILDEKGIISEGKITKNPGAGLAEELQRTLAEMPQLEPAQINTGNEVATEITLEVFCDIVLR